MVSIFNEIIKNIDYIGDKLLTPAKYFTVLRSCVKGPIITAFLAKLTLVLRASFVFVHPKQ